MLRPTAQLAPCQRTPRHRRYLLGQTLIKRAVVYSVKIRQAYLNLVHHEPHRTSFLQGGDLRGLKIAHSEFAHHSCISQLGKRSRNFLRLHQKIRPVQLIEVNCGHAQSFEGAFAGAQDVLRGKVVPKRRFIVGHSCFTNAALGCNHHALTHRRILLEDLSKDRLGHAIRINIGMIKQGISGLIRGQDRLPSLRVSIPRYNRRIPRAGNAPAAVCQPAASNSACAQLNGFHGTNRQFEGCFRRSQCIAPLPFPKLAAICRKLKFFKPQVSEWKRYPLAFAAGLLLACAFPKIGVAGMAWLAPMLMLASAAGHRGGAAFRIGTVAGFAFHLASLYWLLLIPVAFLPSIGWVLLSVYLALFQGVWTWLCWEAFPARLNATLPGILPLLRSIVSTRWIERLRWTALCAVIWVALEMAQARLLGGFPWNLLGSSQYRMLPVIQMSSFFGVYGISFLVAWFSISLLPCLASLISQPGSRRRWMSEVLFPLLALVAATTFGFQRIRQYEKPSRNLKIALVQPSIPQTMIWDKDKADLRLRELIELSKNALQEKPDLMVWPEAAVPNIFRPNSVYYDTNIYEAITNLVQTHKTWLVIGADDIVPRPNARTWEDIDWYNSSFLVSPEGEIGGVYQKQRLVPFGEFVPFTSWIPFLAKLVQSEGNFSPGKGPVAFILPGLGIKTSVLICFEDVFPHLARKSVSQDLDFLLNLTNNGWFGESAAQWQHAAGAVFRAVENGLPLVRAANNGLTCWVDSLGRIYNVYFPGTKDIYGAGYKIVYVPILSGAKRPLTFYTQYGDWFGWSCVALSSLTLARVLRTRRKAAHPKPALETPVA
jgi:apolipoprotein N-acyltransferase